MVIDLSKNADDQRRADYSVLISIITLLIDAEIFSAQDFLERLDFLRAALPEPYQSDDVSKRLALIRRLLEDHLENEPAWTPKVIEGGSEPTA